MNRMPKDLSVLLLYLFAAVMVFPQVVFGGMSFINGDIYPFYHPMWKTASASIRSGLFPFWNPLNSFGAPFFADMQTCVLYPMSFIWYLGDFTRAMNLYILSHVALAAFLTYLWMLELGEKRPAAVLAGAAYGLGGCIVSLMDGPISLYSVCYFPLVLLTVKRALAEQGWRWRCAAALTLSVQLLAGDPAVSFTVLLVLALFVSARCLKTLIAGEAKALRPLGRLTQITAAFLGLTAFIWPLFAEFLARSDRVGFPDSEKLMYSMPPHWLWELAVPHLARLDYPLLDVWTRQTWLENAYAGVTVLILCGVALGAARVSRVRTHAWLVLLGLVLSTGKYSAVYLWLYRNVPLLGLIRYPVRFYFLAAFGIACLAGMGFGRLLDAGPRAGEFPRARARFFAFGLVLYAAALIALSFYSETLKKEIAELVVRATADWPNKPAYYSAEGLAGAVHAAADGVHRSLVFVGLTLSALFVAGHSKALRNVALVAIPLLVVMDLVPANASSKNYILSELLSLPPSNIRVISKDPGLYRVMSSPKSIRNIYKWWGLEQSAEMMRKRQLLAPGLMLEFNIADVSGYDSLYVKETRLLQSALAEPKLMSLFNIKYVASPAEEISPDFERVNRSPAANLFRNRNVMPRAFLVKKAVRVPNDQAVIDAIASKDFDPLETVFIAETPPSTAPAVPGTAESVEITEYSMNRVVMRARVSERPWLFFSDTFYPGWKATIDGSPAKIYRAHTAFRTIFVPPGEHEVVWRYDPWLFKAGTAFSLLTVAGLAALCRRPRMVRKRSAPG